MDDGHSSPRGNNSQGQSQPPFDMDVLVGSILLVGVLLSMALIVAGLVWYLIQNGNLALHFAIRGTNLYRFLQGDIQQLLTGSINPLLLIDLGIAVLMLTPFTRVVASVFYFLFAERNWKFVVFTGFVSVVLIYSLFLH